jgi:CDGSH iron-sulfur domain-containing protein 3
MHMSQQQPFCITDEHVRTIFEIFDADGSGFVEVEELSFAMQAVGLGMLPKETIDELVHSVCPAGTVQVNLSEFSKIIRQRTPARHSVEESVRNFAVVLSAGSEDGSLPEHKHQVTVEDLMTAARTSGDISPGDEAAELRWRRRFTQAVEAAASEDSASRGIHLSTWIRMMQDSVSDKRHRLVQDTASYNIKTRAKVAKRGPYGVRLEEGKTYYYCTCGMSKNQPFCDGSHNVFNINNGTNFEPLVFTAAETKTVWLCGCKQSNNLPFCDGTHSSLPIASE